MPRQRAETIRITMQWNDRKFMGWGMAEIRSIPMLVVDFTVPTSNNDLQLIELQLY